MNNEELIKNLKLFVNKSKIIDLSHTLEENMPCWPTQSRFGRVVYESYDFGDPAIHSLIMMSEHTGTHIDAPKHFFKDGKCVDQLSTDKLMGRAAVIDATDTAPMSTLSVSKIKEFEKKNGQIEEGDFVFIRFGWDKLWATQPNCADYLKDWPGLSKEAAEYLREKKVAAVGCDTLALDVFGSTENPAHNELLKNEIVIIENLNNLSELPSYTYVICMPMKIKGGSGSPIRVFAFTDN